MNPRVTGILCLTAFLSACSDGGDRFSRQYSVDPSTIDVSQAAYCDITQPAMCLFPFPNDYFTREDPETVTGKRVNLDRRAMPVNIEGAVMEPDEYNRNDGFSIGSALLTYVEGIDLEATGAASMTDMGRSLDTDAPVQLIHAATGERQLVWAELDQYPEDGEPRALAIRLGRALENGQRYIVVMQNLVNTEGGQIEPGDAFRVYQEGAPSDIPEIESRREHFESLFSDLGDFGIDRNDLYLTWDFTTISTENTTARALHMRDTSLAALAGAAPEISIDSVMNNTPEQDASTGRVIEGTIAVPNFMNDAAAAPRSNLNYDSNDPDALPMQFGGDGTVEVEFLCTIPQEAFADAADGDTDTQAVVFGHGLFGERDSARSLGLIGEETNAMFCAMDYWGMSIEDRIPAISLLQNLDLFPQMPDRLHQAFLNMIFLSEAIVHSDGFQALPAFQLDDSTTLFRTGSVQYYGISMGTVYGGALNALSPHFDYATLDVAGMNWSLIIRRSNLWETIFGTFLETNYPDGLVRILGLGLAHMIWDRADSNGYANHITRNPLRGSKPSRVLFHNAIGDQILTETAGEYMHRSLGAHRHNPSIVEGRHIAVEPYIGITSITTYPHEDNAVMYFDSGPLPIAGRDGTPLQRADNRGRNFGFPSGVYGYDTHGMPSGQPASWSQSAAFWRTGHVIDVCGPRPCLGDGYDGTPGVYDPANAP